MTTTRTRPTRGEILRALWCIRDIHDPAARRVAHLVDLDQAARPGGARDALCGRGAAKWRAVELIETLTDFAACPDCADAVAKAARSRPPRPPDPLPVPGLCLPGPALPLSRAGQAQPSAPRHDPIGCTPAPPREANTAAARAARRVAFRDVVRLAPDTTDYQPAGNDRRPPSWRRPATT